MFNNAHDKHATKRTPNTIVYAYPKECQHKAQCTPWPGFGEERDTYSNSAASFPQPTECTEVRVQQCPQRMHASFRACPQNCKNGSQFMAYVCVGAEKCSHKECVLLHSRQLTHLRRGEPRPISHDLHPKMHIPSGAKTTHNSGRART